MGTVLHRTLVILKNKEFALVPDNAYVENERVGFIQPDAIHGVPDMVVEVWIPSLSNYERLMVNKMEIYANCGVREYWIVDPFDRFIRKYALSSGAY